MKALVTGSTGKMGRALVQALLGRGDDVRALVRDPGAARPVVPDAVELATGDVTDPAGVAAAVAGCEVVFNAMGVPQQWLSDPTVFDRVNARGAANVAQAAAAAGVRRLVHTSTADVFEPDGHGLLDESRLATSPRRTPYERSKQHAEEHVLAARNEGLEVVIVNPAALYGPGPPAAQSLEHSLLAPLLAGKLPALPPGSIGLAFADGVADGQLLAADRGADGERYILCDAHLTLRELAAAAVAAAGRGRVPPTLPVPVARAAAAAGDALARVTRRPPALARAQLSYFLWGGAPSARRAREELGWTPTPVADGLARTVQSLVSAP